MCAGLPYTGGTWLRSLLQTAATAVYIFSNPSTSFIFHSDNNIYKNYICFIGHFQVIHDSLFPGIPSAAAKRNYPLDKSDFNNYNT